MPNWLPWRERLHDHWESSFFSSLVLMASIFCVFIVEQGWALAWERQLIRWTLEPGLRGVRLVETSREWARERGYRQYVLAERVLELEEQLREFSLDAHELQRLRQENMDLRAMQTTSSFRRLGAEWWGGPRAWWVSVGCRHGARVGNPVVAEGVFVGEVTQVLPSVSAVRTFDDLDWQFPVRVGTESAVGIFSTARGVPEVREVSQRVPVEVGGVVTTTGNAQQPANVPVARVTSVEPEVGFGTWRIAVEPLKMPMQLRWSEVMIDPAFVEGGETPCLTP